MVPTTHASDPKLKGKGTACCTPPCCAAGKSGRKPTCTTAAHKAAAHQLLYGTDVFQHLLLKAGTLKTASALPVQGSVASPSAAKSS